MKTDTKKVPKLRFPGFSDEWQTKKLGDLKIYVSDGNYGEMYPKASEMLPSGVPFIRANNLKNGKLVWDDMKYISPELHKLLKSGHLKTGDILITTRGDIGTLAYVDDAFDDANINAQICLLRVDNTLSSRYLFQHLTTKQGRSQFKQLQTGSALKQLPKGKLALVKVSTPDKDEQQKIAKFLTMVDERIGVLEKQLELSKKYKNGVMKIIFKQKLRFRHTDTKSNIDWKHDYLGNLCKITTGRLDANAMIEGGKYRFYTCAKNYYAIDSFAFNTEALLVSGNGANVGYIHYYKGKFNAYQRTYVLDQFTVNIRLIKYLLDTSLSKRIGVEKKDGNTPYIVMGTLTEMQLDYPNSAEEQEKIADLLTSIDDKINAQERKLEQAKNFKKALLQQIFV